MWLLDGRYATSNENSIGKKEDRLKTINGNCQSSPNDSVTKHKGLWIPIFHGFYILNSLLEPWWIVLKLNKNSIERSSEAMSPWWRPWTWPSLTVIGIRKVQEWPGLNRLLNLHHIKFHLPRDWQGYNDDVCVCVCLSADNENRLMCFFWVCVRRINQVSCVCVCAFWCIPQATFQALGAIIIEILTILFSEPLSNETIKHNHANSIATISLHSYVIFPASVVDEVDKLPSGSGLMKLSSASLILTIWWVNYYSIPVFVFIKCKVMNRCFYNDSFEWMIKICIRCVCWRSVTC